MFQHHPDGIIYVRGTEKTYKDTPDNFATDLGTTYDGLPDGSIGRIYIPTVRHILSDGSNETNQAVPWAEGDKYIAALDILIANQETRVGGIE